MHLFAADGVERTTVRAIAAVAGVSPGLVMHHFGSKDGLVAEVDAHVVKRITNALNEAPEGERLMARRGRRGVKLLLSEPALSGYVARALAEGGKAGADLFHRLLSAAGNDRELVEAGLIREDADPFWRSVQQLVLIVGPLVLRPLVERELGGSLFEEENFERWMNANMDLLENGLYRDGR
jgi:TetR/AcrR family transcriptional regulator, regulator of cefoperazone and chloramphenicol sensitivity